MARFSPINSDASYASKNLRRMSKGEIRLRGNVIDSLLRLSVLTDESGVVKQAMKRRLVLSRIQKTLNLVANVAFEDRPNANSFVILLLTEPTQKPIDGLGFRLKPFEALFVDPSQVSVLHTLVPTTIFGDTQEAG